MLKIKTFIDKSTIPNAGIGCFAAEDIAEGALIWKLDPNLDRIYTDDNLSIMNNLDSEFVKTYAYRHNDLYFLCIDNARFFNHSEEFFNTRDPNNEYCTYASRKIFKGEEIISNYNSFGTNEKDLEFNKIY